MSIIRDVTLTVNGSRSTLDNNIYMYMNDGGITLNIKIRNLEYIINSLTTPVRVASATVLKPNGNKSFTISDLEVDGDKIIFDVSNDMTDELDEVGIYKVQIHLYDDAENRVTIPPFKFYVKPLIGENGSSESSGGSSSEKNNSIAVNGEIYVADSEGLITIPDYPNVPTKTSELDNDTNFVTESELSSQLEHIVNKQFTKNVLYVDKETGQFKTITSAINYAKENNVGKNNRYSIFINNGTYNENLTLDDGIDLYANDKNVIITFSANGFRNGDTLYAPYDCYLKGLTVIQDATSTTEDLQNYSIHIDGRIGDFTLILEDCVFKAIGEWSHHALGAGLHGGQYIIVKNCEFHSDGKPAFYMHNWNTGEITGTKVTLKNTIIYGCKVVDKSSNNYGLLLEDVGSMQTDEIKIEGCEIATLQANGTDICLKKHSGFTGVRNSIIVKLLNSDYRNFSDEIDSGKIITDKDIIAIKSGNIEYGKCCSVLNNNNGILEVNQTAFAESEHCLGLWIPYSGIYGAIRTQGITKGFVNADSGVIAKFNYLTSNSDGSLKKGVVGSGKCFAIALDDFTSGQGYIDVMLVNRC